MSGVTIIDIADMAHTSKSTVSRYLNGGKVKPETEKAIKNAIKKLNYHPNINARRLVTNKTNIIGVVLDDISNTYYSGMLSGMQVVAGRKGYVCTFYSRRGNNTTETEYLNLFLEGQVDGLIMGTFQKRDEEQVRQLADSGYPIVLIGDNAGNANIDCIDVDNTQGTVDEVKYLFSLGHKDIAYLHGPRNMSAANTRAEGFVKACKMLGVNAGMIVDTEWSVDGGFEATQKLLETNSKFTAVLCSNEYCAYGAIAALKAAGKRVPEDISVAAFDDGILSRVSIPAITTIEQPFVHLGEMSMRYIVDMLQGKVSSQTSMLLQPKLIKRASCDVINQRNEMK